MAGSSSLARALGHEFFDKSCFDLSRALLGKILVRQLDNGSILKGRIVETEAYPGESDRASHTFNGKTARNAAMFEKAGTAYVYFIYGMYHCLNFSAKEPGAGVLIRALEPVEGIEIMRTFRKSGMNLKDKELCSGPGRLTQAFDILTATFNMHDLTLGERLWLESEDTSPYFQEKMQIIECSRVGIGSYGQEWVEKPWRYYIHNSVFVSKRDKIAEAGLTSGQVFRATEVVKRKTTKECKTKQSTLSVIVRKSQRISVRSKNS